MLRPAYDTKRECVFALKKALIVALFSRSFLAGTSQAFATPLFTQTAKQAVFLSTVERSMPTWNLRGMCPSSSVQATMRTFCSKRMFRSPC